jgi:uncharacterized integral membrane protein
VNTEQASGAATALFTFGVIVLVCVIGGGLLIMAHEESMRLRRRREARRADVRLARSLGAPWHDVYGGDE